MIRTFRYRIYPTKSQQRSLNDQLAVCCELYNAALTERRDAWDKKRTRISWFDQNRQVAEIKQVREDVKAIHTDVLYDTLHRAHWAFNGFFRRVRLGRKPGFPRYKSASQYDSLTFQKTANVLKERSLRVPKIGKVRIKLHRPIEGRIKTMSVKRSAGHWFALFACEVEAKPLPYSSGAIGIDVGLSSFATLSDGTTIANPRWFYHAETEMRIAQRRLARRKKGSNRRRKAIQILQRVHARIVNRRQDFHHNLSRKLVNEHGLIAVEDLNIARLTKGMFSKSVKDVGWGNFISMLAYKAESAGRVLVRVDPRGTSQTCTCGSTVKKMLGQRWHLCLNCGLSADRDHVAAQVILSRAGVQPSGANVEDLVSCVA